MIEFSKIINLCTKMGYSKPTITNIETLYHNVEVNQVFGAAYVRKILSCVDSTARSLISKLRDMDTHFIMAKRQNDKIGAVLYDSPWIFERCKSKRGLMAMETMIPMFNTVILKEK